MSIHANSLPPFPRHWSPQDLADAVPLRLHQLLRIEAMNFHAARERTGNAPRSRRLHHGYVPAGQTHGFCIRH